MDIGPIGNPLKSSLSLGNKSSSEVNSKRGYPVTGMKNNIDCGLAIGLQQKNSTFDASSYIATYVWYNWTSLEFFLVFDDQLVTLRSPFC